jgi:hypothetical protein
MLEQSGELDRLLDRHVAFWEHRLDRPLLDIDNYVPLLPNPDVPLLGARRAVEGTRIFPEDLDLDAMFRQWPVPYVALNGDYLREASPYGLCWMEGLLGARVAAASGSIWSEPVPFDWSHVGNASARKTPGTPSCASTSAGWPTRPEAGCR